MSKIVLTQEGLVAPHKDFRDQRGNELRKDFDVRRHSQNQAHIFKKHTNFFNNFVKKSVGKSSFSMTKQSGKKNETVHRIRPTLIANHYYEQVISDVVVNGKHRVTVTT